MMIGGEKKIVDRLAPIFRTLAPGVGDVPRTRGREKRKGTAELGYLHCGPNGAGHFVKMVHNGIEYGLMAAYAEGMESFATRTSERPNGKSMRRRRRCAIASITSTTSTWPISPNSGGAAASFRPGFST